MNPERWKRISAVAASAMGLDGADREAFLKQACSGDRELYKEVERLLEQDEQAGGFMENPPIARHISEASSDRSHAGLAENRKLLEKEPSTPRWRVQGELPPELLKSVRQRLGIAAIIYSVGFVIANTTHVFVAHVLFRVPISEHIAHTVSPLGLTPVDVIALTFVAISVLVYALTKWSRLSPSTLVDVGLGYEVIGSFGIGLGMVYGWDNLQVDLIWGVSWICVWVVAYPLIVPATPRRATVAAFLSAAMGPLSLLAWVWLGSVGLPSPTVFAAMTIPNIVCAVLASVGSRMIYKMGTDLERAKQMGSYRLEKLLGRGGMGEVWLARHQMLARPAAIKVVRRGVLGEGDSQRTVLRRFEREAQVTAALSSAHTVKLYDFGVTADNTFYYVMELLEGLDLDSLVQRFGPVPPSRAAYYLKQACLSLGEAHQNGLVHRDIKPANIYSCRVGLEHDFIKVLDFGIVKPQRTSVADVTGLTMEAVAMGTPGYMAPEMAMGGEVDARTDLYSLGCVGYWLVTGHLVFEGLQPLQTIMHHIQTPPQPPSKRTEIQVSRRMDEILLACLEKDPAQRPGGADELSRELDLVARDPGWDRDRARQWWSHHLPEFERSLAARKSG